jgi:hypothetical protein
MDLTGWGVRVVVDVSAEWLEGAPELPDRCVRHGRPAARRVGFVVRSRPKISSRRRMLSPAHTALDRAEEYRRAVKAVRVTGWPLCATCVRDRRVYLGLTWLLFFGGLAALVAAFVAGAVLDGTQPLLLIPILAGFAAMLLSPIPFGRAALPRLTQTEATLDGTAVRVTEPDPEFVARLDVAARARPSG